MSDRHAQPTVPWAILSTRACTEFLDDDLTSPAATTPATRCYFRWMPFFHADTDTSSVAEVLAHLGTVASAGPLWFRGHADDSWSLTPSLFRYSNGVAAEAELRKRFMQRALPFLERVPDSEWAWLFLMQHYGVPTRLLDWSESMLVALYFAVSNPKHDHLPGALWALRPIKLNESGNLGLSLPDELPCFGRLEILDLQYLPARSPPGPGLQPLAAIAVRDSLRIHAQHGVFTISHRTPVPLENFGDQSHLFRMRIPAGAKPAIRAELELLQVNKLTIFPELSSVADEVRKVLK